MSAAVLSACQGRHTAPWRGGGAGGHGSASAGSLGRAGATSTMTMTGGRGRARAVVLAAAILAAAICARGQALVGGGGALAGSGAPSIGLAPIAQAPGDDREDGASGTDVVSRYTCGLVDEGTRRRHLLQADKKQQDFDVLFNQTFWPNYEGFTVHVTGMPSVSVYDGSGAYVGGENQVKIAFKGTVSLLNKWNWVAWTQMTPLSTDTRTVQFRTQDTHAGFTVNFDDTDPTHAAVVVNGLCCYVAAGEVCSTYTEKVTVAPVVPPAPPPAPPPQNTTTVSVEVTETAGVAACGVLVDCREVNMTDPSYESTLDEFTEDILQTSEHWNAATQAISETVAAVTASTVATSVATSIATSVASSIATSVATSTTAATAAATTSSSFASVNVFNPGLFNLVRCRACARSTARPARARGAAWD